MNAHSVHLGVPHVRLARRILNPISADEQTAASNRSSELATDTKSSFETVKVAHLEMQSSNPGPHTMHKYKAIRKVAVLGAGTMGARIAAQVANAGFPCVLLDIVPPGTDPSADRAAKNKIVAAGLEGANKSN